MAAAPMASSPWRGIWSSGRTSSDALVDNASLIQRAKAVLNPRRISPSVEAAGVGSALATDKGNIYVGVCIDAECSLGFCAEHAAIAAMLTAGESTIETIVAVNWDGKILPPCGRCREFIYQVSSKRGNTRIVLQDKTVLLETLLPEHWRSAIDQHEVER